MPYQFRQTGAEIQDILDQVGENTTDIAQNAQDIETINTTLANMSPIFKTQIVSTTYSATSGTATNFTFTVPAQTGYYFVGVTAWSINNNRATLYEITRVSDTSVRMSIQPTATVTNITATIVCLYIKNI